jgi:hypothetical protein
MKIWCILNKNPANKCRESCALWSSFPLAYVSKIFMGKLLGILSFTYAESCVKKSLFYTGRGEFDNG